VAAQNRPGRAPDPPVAANFSGPPGPEWRRCLHDGSRIVASGQSWRFINEAQPAGRYTDAQIDDYQGLRRRAFRWKPPLALAVRARFSHPSGDLAGTAGFGFWNDPFMMTGFRPPALPRAIWFFYASPHSHMKLAMDAPGCGWKAATIDAARLPYLLLAPTAPLAIPLMNIRPLYRALWPVGQRAIHVSEALLDMDLTGWHSYRLEWGTRRACFSVDGETVLDCDTPPRGPLGFVMWIDNQAMTVTPRGRFGWRTVAIPQEQWMEIDLLRIE
jgi:hypothetical protein